MQLNSLQASNAFILWKRELAANGRWTKVPYALDGYRIGTHEADRHRLVPFQAAVNAAGDYDGIGFVFTKITDRLFIAGIDIDGQKPDSPFVKLIIAQFPNAYIELSPSGEGVHIIILVDITRIPQTIENGKPKLDKRYYSKNPGNHVECYVAGLTNRYFTYTGKTIQDGRDVDQTDDFLKFLDLYMLRQSKTSGGDTRPGAVSADTHKEGIPPLVLSDKQILDKARAAKSGKKFQALYDRGDISGYASHSEADQALCNILAFYCQGNTEGIDRLFRQSALYREKWDRPDYKRDTINKAVSNCGGEFYKPKGRSRKAKKLITIAGNDYDTLDERALTAYLADMGVSVRYNVITRAVEIDGVDQSYNPESLANDLPVIIHDRLKNLLDKCDKTSIQDLLGVIAGKNRYNPVTYMLEQNSWDGVDRIQEIYDILHIPESDTLSRTLIYKWFWQCLSMARNELKGAYGADGLLVLQGRQGVGKTTFVRQIAVHHELCKLGQYLDTSDKDTFRRCSSAWIVELGEIETTFKSDLERLKAFITTEIDQYRLPYGRTDQTLARRTSLIGTCNSEQFLIDPTGSRRFWTIPITDIDLNRLMSFESLQLWLQVDAQTGHDRQGFRLTKEEQEQLAGRNARHEKLLTAQAEIMDILSNENNSFVFREVTVSEFKDAHIELRSYSVDQISKALTKLGITQKTVGVTVDGKRTTARVRHLPVYSIPPL